MFFVQFEATPRRNARTSPDAAGALVNCWIERPTLQKAIEASQALVQAEGWIVDEPNEAYRVDISDYPPGAEGREYFEQALIDQEVCVFYAFPEVDGDSSNESSET
jgi:hypothetical protein